MESCSTSWKPSSPTEPEVADGVMITTGEWAW